jgi:hypothetical protein
MGAELEHLPLEITAGWSGKTVTTDPPDADAGRTDAAPLPEPASAGHQAGSYQR